MNTATEGSAEPIYQPSADGFFHIVYKTTNILNGFIYIGIHSTKNIDDGYLGSGKELNRTIKKIGKENFSREILFLMNTREEILMKEKEIVNEEFLERPDVYNRSKGGQNEGEFCTYGKVTVRHSVTGETAVKTYDDPEYFSREWIPITTGMTNYIDPLSGKCVKLRVDDPRVLSGEFKGLATGKITAKDRNGKTHFVSREDPRVLSGELVWWLTGKATYKTKTGIKIFTETNDPRVLSGELVHHLTGQYCGSNNSRFGTGWYHHPETGEEYRHISKHDEVAKGFVRGRALRWKSEKSRQKALDILIAFCRSSHISAKKFSLTHPKFDQNVIDSLPDFIVRETKNVRFRNRIDLINASYLSSQL